MDQVCATRKVCEMYLAYGKHVFWAFMDLEKAYDMIDWYGMWQMLRVYGVGGKLLNARAEAWGLREGKEVLREGKEIFLR